MSLTTLFLGDDDRTRRIARTLGTGRVTEALASGEEVQKAVLTRPVTSLVLDVEALFDRDVDPNFLVSLRQLFPSLGIVLVVDPVRQPHALFQIGQAGVRDIEIVSPDEISRRLESAVQRAECRSATQRVVRSLGPQLPSWVVAHLESAMRGLHHRWDAKRFSLVVGVSTTLFHYQLTRAGLPAVGALLLWSRLFHACHWLMEPGRSGGTVAAQVGYTGWSLRRALRSNLDATPTEIIALGGLPYAIDRFRTSCIDTPAAEESATAGA